MYFYEVWVRSNRYHGREGLTYYSNNKLRIGSIVEVELQNTPVIGFISAISDKPKFKTKEILKEFKLPVIPSELIKLLDWIKEYYPAPIGLITQQVIPSNLSYKIEQFEVNNVEITEQKLSGLEKLNNEQKNAVEIINSSGTYLLHGITGSGKTRVYIELAIKQINSSKSVIILTPEISLTSQLYKAFSDVFNGRVVVLHSMMTIKDRREVWLRCLTSTEPLIVIGPRSALFAPLKKIGLIIIDEEHEPSYKNEQSPQYLTSRVASKYSLLHRSILVLGSATPLISDYYLAEEKNSPIVKLDQLAVKSEYTTDIEIIDKKDLNQFEVSHLISTTLISEIKKTLSGGKLTLLYLNRRGTSRMILCQNCGWQALCPHCQVPLIYHGDNHKLLCHSCSYSTVPPLSCPVCNFTDLIYKTAGTKAVEAEIRRLFPNAKVYRFDRDNTKKESLNAVYSEIISGKADIIIGTQILAKGLDLPNLALVGIILADTNLFLPDYTSSERTFQLINQVIGRVGRGHISGKAIIQTYNPDHKVLRSAINKDYKSFYNSEIKVRAQYLFPPFCFLLKLTVKRANLSNLLVTTNKLKDDLLLNYRVIVEGPAPSFHEHDGSKYRWQLIVKSPNRGELVKIVNNLPANISYDIDPIDLM